MRLLNTHTGKLEWFNDGAVPKYAILSHVWDTHEQTFQDVEKLTRSLFYSLPPGLSAKLRGACKFAAAEGFDWVWVDTCCIDKASSAELSEAINSMFAFYTSADVCIVYLADVRDNLPDPTKEGSDFWKSRWFTRGWTLQELIAPQKVLFVSQGWKTLGTKDEMAMTLEAITGVDKEVLTFTCPVSSVSIAERMSWAANRVTTRREDGAYSLLGLFGVYMPTLYGEGTHAFRRLQEELLRSSPDQSLFAWGFSANRPEKWQVARLGPFADSPARYANDDVRGMTTLTIEDILKAAEAFLSAVTPAPPVLPEQPNTVQPIDHDTPTCTITNYGIRARVPVVRRTASTSPTAIAILAVKHDSSYIGLVVHRLSRAAINHYAVGKGGYRLVRVGSPGSGDLSWVKDLDLVHNDVAVRWEDIYIPTTEPWLAQIRPSIVDMPLKMVSETPESEPSFKLLTRDQHALIALRCLSLMNDSLKQDLCDIRDPSLRNEDVPDLASRIATNIPQELEYASKLWLRHLPLSSPDPDMLPELSTFSSKHLLHWVEAMGLLGELDVALAGLPVTYDWLSKHAPLEEGLLRDADKMIQAHRDILSTSTLQLYHGIAFFDLPDCALSRNLQTASLPKIKLLSRRLGWTSPGLGKMKSPSGDVNSVVFIPDDAHVVSGHGDGSVSVWNYRTFQRETTFADHHRVVYAVTCSQDGRFVASCGDPADVALWEVGTGSLSRVLTGQGRTLQAVAFSTDGLQIAAGSNDGSVRVWSVDTGETTRTFTGHTDWVRVVAFSPADGNTLASGSDDGSIKIWNIAAGDITHDLRGHRRRVASVAFSPDGSQIVSGGENGQVKMWDVGAGEMVQTIPGHSALVTFVAFTPDGFWIISSSGDGTIRKWGATTAHCLSTFTSSCGWIVSLSLSQDGLRIASASGDTIEVWDANTPPESTKIVGHKDAITAVDFAPDGKIFATWSFDNTVCLWKTSTAELLRTIPHDSRVHAVRFSPDDTVLATVSEEPTIRLYGTSSWHEAGRLRRLLDAPGRVWSFVFSTDGSRIACGTNDSVEIWDVKSRSRTSLLRVEHRVSALAFSPDMTRIVTGSGVEDASTRVWEVATGRCIAMLPSQPRIHSLRFSADGRRIISRGYDGRGYDGRVFAEHIPSTTLREPSLVNADEVPLPLRFSWQPDSTGEFGWLHFFEGAGQTSEPLCWFPPERRPYSYAYYAWHDDIVVVGSTNGMLTVIALNKAIPASS